MLLGRALENITNSTLEELFAESIIGKHGLSRTSYTVPNTHQNGVIPGNATFSLWDADLGPLTP